MPNKMNKQEKLSSYKRALGFILIGILVCIPTGYFVGKGIDIDLGRRVGSTSFFFLGGILSVLWGLMKAFLTYLAFSENEAE